MASRGQANRLIMDNFTPKQVQRAQEMYNDYGAHAEWKSWDGRPMPRWADLNDAVRSHWTAVAAGQEARDKQNLVPITIPEMGGEPVGWLTQAGANWMRKTQGPRGFSIGAKLEDPLPESDDGEQTKPE